MNSFNTFNLESDDFEELCEALNSWDHNYNRTGSGTFRGSIFHVQAGSISIFRNRWKGGIHYRGTAPNGAIGMALTINQTGEALWAGKQASKDDLFLQRSGREADYLSGQSWDSIVFVIPEYILAGHISDLIHDDFDDILHARDIFSLKSGQHSSIRNTGLTFLHTAKHLVAEPENSFPLIEMADSVVEKIAFHLITSRKPKRNSRTYQNSANLIRKAEEYCKDHSSRRLQIGKLCRELKVSERTLHHIFSNTLGVTPHQYLKTQKLNKAYKELRKAEPDEVLVKQVAYTNGFHHLGQFSQDFKRLFGESPSHALLYR